MKQTWERILVCALGAALLPAASMLAGEVEPGFKSLFNGQDLRGWAGRPQHWSVADGAITGVTTAQNPAQGNNFLIAKDGDQDLVVSDFELRFRYSFTGPWGNSGLQYRSQSKGNYVVHGYQADFEVGATYSGILYEEGGRGILAERGRKVVIREVDGKTKIETVGSVGDTKEIQASIKTNGWNDYVIIAQGNHLQHFINGKQTVDVVDEQAAKAAKSGILAFQVHQGPPMRIQFKDVRIKSLAGASVAGGDLERMQGEWTPSEIVANGEAVPADRFSNFKLKIKGSEYSLDTGDNQSQGRFKLNEAAKPKAMDVTTDSGDEVPAIYEVASDTLKVCYAVNGAARPAEFKSTDGSSYILTVYKRKAQ